MPRHPFRALQFRPVGGRTYICIDLKTFYASVECVERGLDPFTTNLVVADPDRTEKTICLAITPALKALGVRNRCRVFEIPDGISYRMARPRMKLYMRKSADIYAIYLRYVSAADIHAYSIDECFIDATPYLPFYGLDARGFARMLMDAVLRETGITATAGIGVNLFLAKVALDITAKHDPDGIGELDAASFKRKIWHHRPITDIWNIGPGIARRLEKYAVYDLAGVAAMSRATLYREFGVNAEFLIDHAHGYEPCTIAQIKAYKPEASSLGSGQVLPCDYRFDEALVVLREMVDDLVLDLVDKRVAASGISLTVGYAAQHDDASSASHASGGRAGRAGSIGRAGRAERERPQPATFVGEHGARSAAGGRFGPHSGGQRKLPCHTNSFRKIWSEFERLYRETTDDARPIRRLSIGIGGLEPEELAEVDLFADIDGEAKERSMQEAILAVKEKFGKNALLRATSLTEKATARERHEQVGGHHG